MEEEVGAFSAFQALLAEVNKCDCSDLPNYPYCGSEIGSRVQLFDVNSGKHTHCRDMDHKFEPLPGHTTECLLAHQYKAASGLKLLPQYG